MKKKVKIIYRKLKMPRLYRDDLESIEKLIQEDLKPREYKVETKDYEYDKIEMIPKDTKSVIEFHVKTHGPFVSIDFNQNSASIYTNDDSSNTIGVVTKILQIILEKERRILYWVDMIGIIIAPALFIASIQGIIQIDKIDQIKQWVLLISLLFSTIWWSVSFYSKMYRFSLINFNYSQQDPGFIKRNKDQIILIILSTIIGSVFTFLFQKLFK